MAQKPVSWYERDIKKSAWATENEIAVFSLGKKKESLNADRLVPAQSPELQKKKGNNFVNIYSLKERLYLPSQADSKLFKSFRSIAGTSPVFFPVRKKTDRSEMALTSQIIVRYPTHYSEQQIELFESNYSIQRRQTITHAKNTFIYQTDDALQSITIANKVYESGEVLYAYPNWLRGRSTRTPPDDLYFPAQWHLENRGQTGGTPGEDIDILEVWDQYDGGSSVIAIVDDGLELIHEDLAANTVTAEHWDYIDNDFDPTGGEHGTACAGIAAGLGNNGIGISGVAPGAGLAGLRLLGAGTDSNEADALSRAPDLIDIYSNSWGPEDDGYRLEGPGPLTEDAIEYGMVNGRNGLGSIYVWAGGNGALNDDNSNYDGYANSRYTIAVASSDHDGKQSLYSEKGANILVNAPSSFRTRAPFYCALTTTDRTGNLGYNALSYTNTFGGTSGAAAIVSGVIALILDVNPLLSWRDVQQILIASAERNDSTHLDWTINSAGYWLNHAYGFGRVNAQAAVNLALSWQSVGKEFMAEDSAFPVRSIADNDPLGIEDSISVDADINIESVEVVFSAPDHTSWGDLKITLTSPAGTESILAESHSGGTSAIYDQWRFGTLRHYGESSTGVWTLTVADMNEGETGTFKSWNLKIYGTANGNLHTITVNADTGGRISPAGPLSVLENSDTTFTIEPDSGYELENVIVDGISIGKTQYYTFENISSDHSITATFSLADIAQGDTEPDGDVDGIDLYRLIQNIERGTSTFDDLDEFRKNFGE